MKIIYSSYLFISVGVLLAIAGSVRSGGILISLGTIGIASTKFFETKERRKIEFILPVALAALLFVVALTLPHAK